MGQVSDFHKGLWSDHRAIRDALRSAKRIVVIEKAFSIGVGGIVSENVKSSIGDQKTPIYTVIAGLGGRPITMTSLQGLFDQALNDSLEPLTFLDLDHELVEREISREGSKI